MSTARLKKYALYGSTAVLGLCLGIVAIRSLPQGQQRHLASIPANNKLWQKHALGKNLAPVKVAILDMETLPLSDQEEVLVHGQVYLNQNLQGSVYYRWILPAGSQLIDGNLEGHVVLQGQQFQPTIRLIGFSKEQGKTLALEAYIYVGDQKIGNTALIASRPEDSMESIAREKMQARQNTAQESF